MKTKTEKLFSKIIFSILILCGFFLVLQNIKAISYETLGGRPAYPDPNVEKSSAWFIYHLKPGESKEDGALIVNNSDKSRTVLIYPADGAVGSSGGFALKQLADQQQEVGTWVTLYPDDPPEFFQGIFKKKDKKISYLCNTETEQLIEDMQKEGFLKEGSSLKDDDLDSLKKWCQGTKLVKRKLKPQERVIIPFIFHVPQNVDVGEHTGGILIQKVGEDQTATVGGSAVKLTLRMGIRIYETVPGKIIKHLKLEKFSVKKNFKEFDLSRYFFAYWFGKGNPKPEEYIVSSTVKNEGNTSIEHQDIIYVKDILFKKRSEEVKRNFQVLRGSRFDSNYGWHNPRFGWFSFKKEIKYNDENGTEQTLFTDEIKLWIIPWREITLALFIFLIAYVSYKIWKYRQKKKYGGEGWIEYTIQEGDTVNSLAEKHNINWKILAKTNKLKAPYALKVGQIILVPPLSDEDKLMEAKTENIQDNQKENKENNEKANTQSVTKENIASKKINKSYKKIILWMIFIFSIIVVIAGSYYFINKNRNDLELKKEITISSVGGYDANKKEEQKEDVQETATKNNEEKNTEESNQEIDPAKINITILNGGAAPGSAGKISNFLKSKKYTKVNAKNASNKEHSGIKIYYQNNYKQAAQEVMDLLNNQYSSIEIKPAESQEEKMSNLVIIVGK